MSRKIKSMCDNERIVRALLEARGKKVEWYLSYPSKLFDDMTPYQFVEALIKAGCSENEAWLEIVSVFRRAFD